MDNIFSLPNEKTVRNFCYRKLVEMNVKVVKDNFGNLIAWKGDTKLYPTLNAHLDSIYETKKEKTVLKKRDYLYSPQGISGDDKAGLWIALSLMDCISSPLKLILTSQEESGGIGSSHLKDSYLKDSAYILTLDRRGNSDIITNIYNSPICSKAFKASSLKIAKKYKYKENEGIFSDAYEFASRGIDCLNLSVGYHNPHSKKEFISINDMLKATQLVLNLIKNIPIKKYRHHPIFFEENSWLNKYMVNLY